VSCGCTHRLSPVTQAHSKQISSHTYQTNYTFFFWPLNHHRDIAVSEACACNHAVNHRTGSLGCEVPRLPPHAGKSVAPKTKRTTVWRPPWCGLHAGCGPCMGAAAAPLSAASPGSHEDAAQDAHCLAQLSWPTETNEQPSAGAPAGTCAVHPLSSRRSPAAHRAPGTP